MSNQYAVPLKTIVSEHDLRILHAASGYETDKITTADINRPGLQLSGYYDYFDERRIQIIGIIETGYLQKMTAEERKKAVDEFMGRKPSALIICHQAPVLPEIMDAAVRFDVNVLETEEDTSEFSAQLIGTLRTYLAPRETRHGVLVEVHGEGILITGESGIGKSETALELIKRGHRLIADDAVEIRRVSRHSLIGSAPELIRYYMELRGIGVVNVRHLFGMGAVKPQSNVDLVIMMEPWDNTKAYDRLGLSSETANFVGVDIPQVTIPVRPGRNLAVIMELAAMNNRQKKMGYNAAETLAMEHDMAIDAGLI